MQIDNEIPRSHPHRRAIERAVLDALGEASDWKAWIHVAPYKRIAWVIQVETGRGPAACVVAGPGEQTAEFIGAALRAELAGAF